MRVMAEKDINQLLRERLEQAGLLGCLDEKRSSLFPTPEGVLADIVLKDASALESAQKVVEQAERELEQKGVWLLPTVRALWGVKNVEGVGGIYQYGLPEALGILFRALLQSGGRTQEVWVSVAPSAFQVLKPLLAGGEDALRNIVRDFLGHQLSIGGAGYWDPIRHPHQELDEGAARYMRWRPYEQLKRSVDHALGSLEDARRFLKCFSGTGGAHDFNAVLGKLAGPGGAIARGEQFQTSNYQLYELLLDIEKKELETYYLQRLAEARKKWSELDRDFAQVLAA